MLIPNIIGIPYNPDLIPPVSPLGVIRNTKETDNAPHAKADI